MAITIPSMKLCRRRHSADDAQQNEQSVCQDKASMDGATAQQQQQQRLIDLLQLRSDELSAENGKLRVQMARADKQLPGQLQNDYPFSHMSGRQQNDYTGSRAALAMHQHQHASQPGGASPAGPLRPAGQCQAGHAPYTDRYSTCTCTTDHVVHLADWY